MNLRLKKFDIKFLEKNYPRWNFIKNFNQTIFTDNSFSTNSIDYNKLPKEIFVRIFGNETFWKKNLFLAIELYSLSLSIIPLDKKLERSFCFSNRAQCLLSLNMENYSLFDCEMALRLVKNHEKSWFRKMFVFNKKKDHAGNFLNLWKITSLSEFLGKIQPFSKAEGLSKTLVRLEKNLSKQNYWKKLQSRVKKKSLLKIKKSTIINNKKNCKPILLENKRVDNFCSQKQLRIKAVVFVVFFLGQLFCLFHPKIFFQTIGFLNTSFGIQTDYFIIRPELIFFISKKFFCCTLFSCTGFSFDFFSRDNSLSNSSKKIMFLPRKI